MGDIDYTIDIHIPASTVGAVVLAAQVVVVLLGAWAAKKFAGWYFGSGG